MIEAYPLDWPIDYKRTPVQKKKCSQFKNTLGAARDFLKEEVRRLGGKGLIISTNVPVKQNGDLYADFGRYKIEDPGVAIYFDWNDKHILMCCDQYYKVWENITALAKAIQAIRGLERWGVSEFLERAFTGFKALPEHTESETSIWETLGLSTKPASVEIVKSAFRERSKIVHPDKATGSREAFTELQNAYEKALNLFKTEVLQ